MVCIHCGSKTSVVNSRQQRRANQVWRRRLCDACGAVFTSIESAELSRSWYVSNTHSKLTPFSRDKLFLSLYNSCQHRKDPLSDAGGLADTVLKRLLTQIESGVLSSQSIKETIQVTLNRFDKAASTHYRAFHT